MHPSHRQLLAFVHTTVYVYPKYSHVTVKYPATHTFNRERQVTMTFPEEYENSHPALGLPQRPEFTLFGYKPGETGTGATYNVNLKQKKKKRRLHNNPITMTHVPGSSLPPGEIYEWIIILHNTEHEDQEEADLIIQGLASRSESSASERFVLRNTNHNAYIEAFDIRNRWSRKGTGSWTDEECIQRSKQIEEEIIAWRKGEFKAKI